MEKISLDFEKGNGLIPVVIQDYESNEVLMLAYMSQESFNLTLKHGFIVEVEMNCGIKVLPPVIFKK